MSNTYKTNKARLARTLGHQAVAAFNAGEGDKANQLWAESRGLEVNGARYGNKRKSKAQDKVIARRAERRDLKQQIPTTVD